MSHALIRPSAEADHKTIEEVAIDQIGAECPVRSMNAVNLCEVCGEAHDFAYQRRTNSRQETAKTVKGSTSAHSLQSSWQVDERTF